MGRLIHTTNTSLDGYIEDETGSFQFGPEPSPEWLAMINENERSVRTYLYGRRIFEAMRIWQEFPGPDGPALHQEYAGIWRAADKVVFSRTLDAVTTPRTRLERELTEQIVQDLKDGDGDVSIAGAELAGIAFRAGWVDVLRISTLPVIVGGGKPALPDGLRQDLTPTAQRRFANGVVFTEYAMSS
jgi:dihydrofolate reductase